MPCVRSDPSAQPAMRLRVETTQDNRTRGEGAAMSADPWQHRSQGMKCISCMYFVLKTSTHERNPMLGRCRRRAPTLNGYPVVFEHDWCGDHKLDENYYEQQDPV